VKNKATIHMGASRFDVTVNHNGTPVTFDLYRMTKDKRREFHREFMKAIRSSLKAA
jgi:hypothetical protein